MSQELAANRQRCGKTCARVEITAVRERQADLAQRIAPMRVVSATACVNIDGLPIFSCLQSLHAGNREQIIHIVSRLLNVGLEGR
jgi:hypothetical protein